MNLIPRDSLFDFDNLFGGLHPLTAKHSGGDNFFAPRVDVHNKRNRYVIDAELPGVDKDHVNVSFENGVLTIDAEMKDETSEEEEGNIVRRERRFGQFSRSFYLGDEVKESNIKASFKNGLLKLEIPKSEPEKPEKVQIEVS
jgi:HSP20 family protein